MWNIGTLRKPFEDQYMWNIGTLRKPLEDQYMWNIGTLRKSLEGQYVEYRYTEKAISRPVCPI
jgi:hypothetical protein